MKKAIIIASVASMIDQFNRDNINLLQELGFEVSVACNFEYGSSTSNEQVKKLINDLDNLKVKHYHVPIPRSLFALKDMFESYKFLKQLGLKEKYNLMHCHSPIGGVLARLAFKELRKQGTRVIYTAHGFHFYEGAPLKNWLIFYPIEKYCSKFTDCLITINKEDYYRAKEKFHAKEVEYVPGIGIHVKEIQGTEVDIDKKKAEFGITNEKILVSVGELNANKNHEVVIKSLARIKTDQKYKYILCGKGNKEEYLKSLVKQLNLEDKVIFAGYRNDVREILKISDIFCFPSYREGLSVALMEAMAVGLPVVCSKIRGNVDLIDDGKGGLLFLSNDTNECIRCIEQMLCNENKIIYYKKYNLEKIKKFDKNKVFLSMRKIFQ
ncbi:glycosyltransferase family 4 protein [Thomasclavelia spiroformis]|jgi:glycosyltransferase involved in cell wall biosynthesis|uniref:glycosyltransferase family 4 protein n=1 Tax=Thomasclavelia spiroformis TaxID=29348 RepID=UPI00241DAE2A|nr:glycosyltransferase family 4 protein [Thomasclavelia spiroformis]MBS6115836.1 glycosyltransferase family 4 protein [Thomasclavelia spiroformis]